MLADSPRRAVRWLSCEGDDFLQRFRNAITEMETDSVVSAIDLVELERVDCSSSVEDFEGFSDVEFTVDDEPTDA